MSNKNTLFHERLLFRSLNPVKTDNWKRGAVAKKCQDDIIATPKFTLPFQTKFKIKKLNVAGEIIFIAKLKKARVFFQQF